MALKFSSSKRFVPAADGNRELPQEQQIALDIRLPKVRDMLEIQEMIRSVGGTISAVMDGSVNDRQALQMWQIMETLICKHTSQWTGISLDGAAVTDPDGVLKAVGMDAIAMISEVAQEIMLSGKGSVDESKNSVSESEPENLVSGSTVTRVLPLDSSKVATVAAST